MKRTYDTFGDPWECDGERFRFYSGDDENKWSRWHAGDFVTAENYMASMGCEPETVEWEECDAG